MASMANDRESDLLPFYISIGTLIVMTLVIMLSLFIGTETPTMDRSAAGPLPRAHHIVIVH